MNFLWNYLNTNVFFEGGLGASVFNSDEVGFIGFLVIFDAFLFEE